MKAVDVARFLLSLDTDNQLFNKKLITMNGRNFYEGNARLNKFLHLAQNIYLAKYGKKLYEDDLYAYDNGAVVPTVQENYTVLLARKQYFRSQLNPEEETFIRKVFEILHNATVEELILLSHEDAEWQERSIYWDKPSERMDSEKHIAEYKHQYADIIKVLDRIQI